MLHRIKPTTKIAFGLALLTLSILLSGQLLGLLPNENKMALDYRVKLLESMTVQFSLLLMSQQYDTARKTLEFVVARNDDVLSASFAGGNGITIDAGDHSAHWVEPKDGKSTLTHVLMPIIYGDDRRGMLRVAFGSVKGQSGIKYISTLTALLLFVGIGGFIAYRMFIARALRELDPNAVVPERVRVAFNVLSEGLLILDDQGRIVLANDQFASIVDRPVDKLTGVDAKELPWHSNRARDQVDMWPWEMAIKQMESVVGVPLRLWHRNEERIFSVNAAPIVDGGGDTRGVIATFDDLTELESKHQEQKKTLAQLKRSENDLRQKTEELEHLATHDPLTGRFNRRAFFAIYEKLFASAQQGGGGLVIVMLDIDHFKSVNDNYGHAVGDQVIIFLANTLQAMCRSDDIVGRYGGEEFIMMLPYTDLEQGRVIAERLRKKVEKESHELFSDGKGVTSSFGLAYIDPEVKTADGLVQRADEALYAAKNSGRNRVVCWGDEVMAEKGEEKEPIQLTSRTEPRLEETEIEMTDEIHRLKETIQQLESELQQSKQGAKRQA